MRRFCGILLSIAALLLSANSVASQTTSNSAATDLGITLLSVLGVVSEIQLNGTQVIVKTAAGNDVTVTISERTQFMRIPPGEKTKDKFIQITGSDFGVGDSVFARGRISEDRKLLPALEFYVMSKSDISEKRERDRDEWRKRGIVGPITALNAETKEITVNARSPEGPKPVVITTKSETEFRRYAPDSVRFSDAKSSSFAELTVGDQLRALGTRSTDSTHFTPEEIVSGSFQTIGAKVTSITPESNEIKVSDLQSNQPITVMVSKDSKLRQLTPEVIAALTPSGPPASGGTAPPAPSPSPSPSPASTGTPPAKGGDLQEMFEKLPALKIQDLKPGDVILISSTKGVDPTRMTAIALVNGVGPLLSSGPAGRPNSAALGGMNLGGIGGP